MKIKKFLFLILANLLICIFSKNFQTSKCVLKVKFDLDISVNGGSQTGEWSKDCETAITKDFALRDGMEEYKPCVEVD